MKAFERIATETVRQAEAVNCSLADFAQGLRDIRDAVQERLELEEDAIRNNKEHLKQLGAFPTSGE